MAKVRVRRDRPSGLTWAIALAVTMLAVYLATLSAPVPRQEAESASAERVTRELVLEGVTAYFADLGQYASASQARIAAAILTERGAAGCVWTDGAESHVLGAAYDISADAERIAEQIGAQEGLATSVLTRSAGAVSMRVTAPEADVDRIARANDVLRAQLVQTGALALQVDRGEVTAAAARTLAAVSRSELRAALEALGQVSGAQDSPVCVGLMEQLDNLAGSLGSVARGTETGAALSGRLRCCHVDATLRLIDFMRGLQA